LAGVREGRGIFRYAVGDSYAGQGKADEKSGRGTFHQVCGRAEVGVWRADERVGVGVAWFADRQAAWRTLDGEEQAELSPREARDMAAQIGLPVPPSP
jgi:hypothetical protein